MARRFATAVTLLALSLGLVACGDDDEVTPDDAPRDAAKADFCTAWAGEDDVEPPGPDASVEEQAAAVVATYRADSAGLQETGTPADIPDDARDGFEILLTAASELTEEMAATSIEQQDVDFLGPLLEGDDATAVEVFTGWADDYCA